MKNEPEIIDTKMGIFTIILQLLLLLGGIILIILFQSCGPSSSRAALKGDALNRYNQALVLYSEGRYRDAADLLAGFNNSYSAQVLRGRALFFISNYKDGETALKRALQIRPSSIEGRLYLAYIQRAIGKVDEARKLAEDILADDPENLRAYRVLADLAEASSSKRVYLDQALEGMGEAALLFVERARSRWISGDGHGALQDVSAALVLLPEESTLRPPVLALQKSIASQWQEQER